MMLDVDDDFDNDCTISGTMSLTWSISKDGSMIHKESNLKISASDGVEVDGKEYKMSPQDIELENEGRLGAGAGGVVQRAIHKPSGMAVAIKTVKVDNKSKRDQMLNEIRGLIHAEGCANLVQWYAAFVARSSGSVHVALELMDRGSLADLQKKFPKGAAVPEKYLSCITRQMLNGLSHLHKAKMLHRDIKPANVLVNSSGVVKLTDFGISRDLNSSVAMTATFVGTAIYMSPERALGSDYGLASDIWSVGIIVFELAAGRNPFPNSTSFPVLFDFLCTQPEPRLEAEAAKTDFFSPDVCDFVHNSLTRDQVLRWDAEKLGEHSFILAHGGVKESHLAKWLEKVYTIGSSE